MSRLSFANILVAGVIASLSLAHGRWAAAQGIFYSHTSAPGGDGFVWDFDNPPSGLMDL